MKGFFLLFFVLLMSHLCFGQMVVPAPKQDTGIILLNGTAHIGNGQIIENSAIGIEKGKITFVADARTIKLEPSGKKIINIAGKQVYPGIIAPNTTLGLSEIEAARATNDYYEVGEYNPNIRSLIAYNTDSKVIPTIRSNGVLLAQVVPQGGVISGSSSVMQLDAWNWQDAAYRIDDGIHLNWPSYFAFSTNTEEAGRLVVNKEYEPQVNKIRQFFNEALAYSKDKAPAKTNLKFEAMRGLFDSSKTLYIHADNVKEITGAVNLSKGFHLHTVIVGGGESYKCIDLLKENNVPVILQRIQSLPDHDDDAVDQPYKTPYLLQQAGVFYCLSLGGFWQQRNLMFDAGQAVGYGLTKEQALSAITSSTAKILGVGKTTGTIESGKDANIIVSEGDILDMRTSVILYAFIQGRQINLDNKQKDLYEIYKKKYGEK